MFFVEEGIRDGGAGMLLGERLGLPSYTHIAIDGHFAVPTSKMPLRAACGIDGEGIARRVLQALSPEKKNM